jgi:hypothetical protein
MIYDRYNRTFFEKIEDFIKIGGGLLLGAGISRVKTP